MHGLDCHCPAFLQSEPALLGTISPVHSISPRATVHRNPARTTDCPKHRRRQDEHISLVTDE